MSININDPWNRGDDPLGDIESTQLTLIPNDHKPIIYIHRGAPYLSEILNAIDKINEHDVIVVDSLNDANVNVNVGTPGHIDILLPGVVHNVPVHCRFDTYDTDPLPALVKSNNKPWYQDRKHFKNKKSRRKL